MKNPYNFHTHFDTEPATKGNLKGTCPFCNKENHFFFNEETFQWDCKVCSLEGNVYTFIALLHDRVCVPLTESIKGIPLHVIKANNIKYNPFNDTVVIPTYALNGSINNLYKYVSSNNNLYGTPTLSSTIYNAEPTPEQEVWLCEGHWDKLAAEAMFGSSHQATALGAPGASSFKPPWTQYFRDRDLIICYDADEAGSKGITKVLRTIADSPQKPRTVSVVQWPEGVEEGYDIRDAFRDHGVKTYKYLKSLAEPAEDRNVTKVTTSNIVENTSCSSYQLALDSFRTAFHTTPDMEAALALVMASIWSIKLNGMEQLWLKIIGVPGSGKTRIAKALSASDQVVSKSSFTGLFSGWKETPGDNEDHGLIPIISGKTLIVKDADALLRQPDVERIFSEMRDFYDKDSSVHFRSNIQRDYRNIKSTFIICGTQQLRSADHSFLGERFMSVELNVTEDDKRLIDQKVLDRNIAVATGKIDDPEIAIMADMKGWINHLMRMDLDSEIDKNLQQIIVELASLTALMRTTVSRDRRRRITTPAVPEMPGRIIGQAIVAAFALCVVYGINKADSQVYKTICKMIRDTINPRSDRYKICKILIENPNITAGELALACQLNQRSIDDEIDDMHELGIIQLKKIVTSNPDGNNKWRYKFELNEDVEIGLQELDN